MANQRAPVIIELTDAKVADNKEDEKARVEEARKKAVAD